MAEQKPLPNAFEDAIQELETIVEQLEQGDLTLDAALSHFERGVTLTKHSQQALNNAEQKVKILLQNKEQNDLSDWQNSDNE